MQIKSKNLYPISLAVKQAEHVAKEKHLGQLCVNALKQRSLTTMVSLQEINELVELMVSDTYYYKEYK